MTLAAAVLGTAGLGAIVVVLIIMGRLTQRWELVTRSRSGYQLFFVAAALIIVASVARLVRAGYLVSGTGPPLLSSAQSWFYLCAYHLPLSIAMTISLIVTWRNWGWLLREPSS
jgi:hypothetical protein